MSVSGSENSSGREEILLRDADIWEPLFDYLEECFPRVRFLEEKVTGRARADVVMVLPEEIWGIEIKSDADSYARLPTQVKNYDRYYDRNVIAAGSRHALHVKEHVPEHWGILTVEWLNGGGGLLPAEGAGQKPRSGSAAETEPALAVGADQYSAQKRPAEIYRQEQKIHSCRSGRPGHAGNAPCSDQ